MKGVSVQLVSMRWVVITIAVIAAAIGLLWYVATMEQRTVEADISRDMLDPDATQFRNVEQCAFGDPDVWQGEFNAKNRLGAYTGYKRFLYADGRYATAIYDDDLGEGDWQVLSDRCHRDL